MLRIEELRTAAGMTLRDLDQATGISQQNIWRYSVGKQSPSIERAYLLSRALGVTLDELYVHEGEAVTASEPRGEVAPTHTKAPTDAAERLTVGAFAQGD